MKFPLCQGPAEDLPTFASRWVFPRAHGDFVEFSAAEQNEQKGIFTWSANTEVNELIPELTGSSHRPMFRPFENSILNDYSASKQKKWIYFV